MRLSGMISAKEVSSSLVRNSNLELLGSRLTSPNIMSGLNSFTTNNSISSLSNEVSMAMYCKLKNLYYNLEMTLNWNVLYNDVRAWKKTWYNWLIDVAGLKVRNGLSKFENFSFSRERSLIKMSNWRIIKTKRLLNKSDK